MLPPAPPLFSTITRWPSFSLSSLAMRRAVPSAGPPAANVTTSVTGRAGQVSAAWLCGASTDAIIAANANIRARFMSFAPPAETLSLVFHHDVVVLDHLGPAVDLVL